MVKNRAHDSRRVFQTPASHVKVRDVSERYTETDDGVTRDEISMKGADRPKYDAFGKTDFERTSQASVKETRIGWNTDNARMGGGLMNPVSPKNPSRVPVVKVKS